MASPFWAYATKASSMILSMGTLRESIAPSAPSASTQPAPSLTPASLIKVLTLTPVHSDVLVRPCAACAVLGAALREASLELPEHSTKMVREMEGKRLRSATEYFI